MSLKFVQYLLVQLISPLSQSASLEKPYMQKYPSCLSLHVLIGHGLTFLHLESVASLSFEFAIDSINCRVYHQFSTLLYRLHSYFRTC